jgi:cytochrome c-type biogenesis protein CcmH
MTAFLAGAVFLLAATLFLLLRPWWQKQRTARTQASRRALNATIYRDQLAELERDRAEGSLDETDYQNAYQELQRRLIEDSAADEPAATALTAKASAIAIAVGLPVLAVALYLVLGNPAGLNPQPAQKRFTADEIEQMVAGLAARLEKEPDNLQGWVMLARSYKVMDRFAEAEKAYSRAKTLVDSDAGLLADYAEVVAMAAGGDLEGRPRQLLDQALKLDPDHPQALLLSGTAAFERGDFARAVTDWERLKRQVPSDSENAQVLDSGIAKAKEKAAAGKK